jgi:CxxC-x17-CxxC domain-containing protein
MGNFKRDGYGGDRGSRDRGGRSDRQMYHAVCSDCGRDCEVPFKPTGDKPVFCSECFGNKDGGDRDNNRRSERRSNDRVDSRDRPMFDAVCDECGSDCQLPFRPSSDKPVYCSACFEKVQKNNRGSSGGGGGQDNKQFEMLNKKLDSILEMLGSAHPVKKNVEAVKEVKTVVESVKKEIAKKTPVKKVVLKKATPKKVVKKAPAKKVAVKKSTKKAAPKKKK